MQVNEQIIIIIIIIIIIWWLLDVTQERTVPCNMIVQLFLYVISELHA